MTISSDSPFEIWAVERCYGDGSMVQAWIDLYKQNALPWKAMSDARQAVEAFSI